MDNTIWDLDGTLVPTSEKLNQHYADMAAKILMDVFRLPLTADQTAAMIVESYLTHNDWTYLPVRDHQVNQDSLLKAYDQTLDHSLVTPHPDLPDYFSRLSGNAHAILTHASSGWTDRILTYARLDPYFPKQNRVAFEDYKICKHLGPEGFKMALDRLGSSATDTRFVDDTLVNLEQAAKLGLKTIFMSAGRAVPANAARYVDHVEHDACAYLRGLLKAQTP